MSRTSARNTGAPRRTPRASAGRAPALLIAAAAAVLAPWRAGAAPPKAAMQLDYQRAPGAERCPREDLLREEMARQLGYDPVHPEAAMQAKALVFRGPGTELHATMDVYDAAGLLTWSRHLVAYNDDCRELVLNMALALRVAVDPRLRAQPEPAHAAPTPLPSPAPEAEAPAAAPARAAGPGMLLGLGVGAAIGVLPAVSPGLSLSGAIRYPSFSLGLEGSVHAPVELRIDRLEVAMLWFATASAAPCIHDENLFGCALVSLGALARMDDKRTLSSPNPQIWLAVGPRAGVELPLSERFAVQFHGDIALRLTPLDLSTAARVLWSSSTFGGHAGIALVIDLSPAPRGATAPRAPRDPGAPAPH
ncbi:hypothetical protein [Sorangium sp. So ce131]|uniref:hypothetical protein n=1 Tax=Sorangium sp. So ce131 TaxID=3133282 RepID=UPI003F5E079E